MLCLPSSRHVPVNPLSYILSNAGGLHRHDPDELEQAEQAVRSGLPALVLVGGGGGVADDQVGLKASVCVNNGCDNTAGNGFLS